MTTESNILSNGLMIVQGNRMEDLCATYVQWLKRYPLQPLEQEFLVAPSNGIAQWLKHYIAQDPSQGGCGVAAGMQTMLPAQWVWHCYRQLLPGLQVRSLYDKSALTWRLFRLLQTVDLSTQAPLLQTYLGANSSSLGYFNLATQLADLYDQYQIFRPDWLRSWQQSEYVLLDYHGQKRPLAQAHQWQGYIWQLLCADIQQQESHQPTNDWSRHDRGTLHQQFLAACQTLSDRPRGIPRRVVIFGVSSLPQTNLELLQALAPYTQIMLFVLNPCQYYWGDIMAGKALFRTAYKRQQKRPPILPKLEQAESGLFGQEPPAQKTLMDTDTWQAHGNPLLASWGRQGRDFLHMLDAYDQPEEYANYFSGRINLFTSPISAINLSVEPTDQPNTQSPSPDVPYNPLLMTLQDDILQLRSLEERPIQPLAAADTSVSFIVTHSIQREIEVVHDRLLAEFELSHHGLDNEPLQAKDILIMVPDIEAYAPHIESVFGRYKRLPQRFPDEQASQSHHDERFLPYHIADTGQRYSNPLLIAFELLLNLPNERLTALQGLSLLEVDSCRERFGIKEQDLPAITAWIKDANIRWALNAEHRTALDIPPQAGENTWQFGIERLLLGYAIGQDATWQNLTACPQVAPMEAELLGRLHQFISHLQVWRTTLSQWHTPTQWVDQIMALWEAMLVEPSLEPMRYQTLYLQVNKLLQTWLETIDQASLVTQPIPLDVVKESVFANLDEPSLSSRFVTGAINFATLMPMRAVPFKQIWLLGMNDDAYPRWRPYNDFDLMSQDYRPGDRSRRDDDRYLFLEALLSARDKLVIGWHGRNIKDDSLQPPSVLVGQLRDYINQGWEVEQAENSEPGRQHAQTRGHQTSTQALSIAPNLSVLAMLTAHYPLHPFSRDYFVKAGRQDTTELFTYVYEWSQQTRQVILNEAGGKVSASTQASLPPWQPDHALGAHVLGQFLSTPVASLYYQRLSVKKRHNKVAMQDSEPFDISHLDAWWFNQQTIKQLCHGKADRTLQSAIKEAYALFDYWQQSGQLLPGTAGVLQKEPIMQQLIHLLKQWFALLPTNHLQANPLQANDQQLSTSTDKVFQRDFCISVADEQGHPKQLNINLEISLAQLYIYTASNHIAGDEDIAANQVKITQIIVQPTKIYKNKKWRWKNLVEAFIKHLGAHGVSSYPVTTYVLSPEGSACFKPLDQATVNTYWDNLLDYWCQGMCRPLPLGIHLGMALANTPSDNDIKALASAYKADAELDSDFFTRHYPHLETLDLQQAETIAQALYMPMQESISELDISTEESDVAKGGSHV